MTFLLFTGAFTYFFFLFRGLENQKVLPAVFGFSVFLLLTRVARVWASNQTISMLLHMSSVASLAFVVYTLGLGQTMRSLWEVVTVPFRILAGYLRGIWGALMAPFNFNQKMPQVTPSISRFSIVRSVVVGVLLAIPVIALLLSLLGSADPIFAFEIKKVFSWDILVDIPKRLFWSLFILIFFTPFSFLRLKDRVNAPLRVLGNLGWHRELTVVMALVAATVAGFLVIQWPYVFANVPAETDLSKFGVATYSEYVQKGFGELLRVAALLYVVVWVGLLTTRDSVKKLIGTLPLFQWVVMGELMLFVVSVFRRIWLYQQLHGWTLVRIYGGVFLLWIAGMIVFLALRHIAKKRWVVGELIMTAAVILSLGFFNVEHFIATTHPPTVNKRVDYVYLSGMSPDGYVGWKMGFDWASNVLLNSGLDKKDRLDALDRRDIAYAGVIMHRLSRQYHRLVLNFGSDEEQLQYTKTLLNYQQQFEGGSELIHNWKRELDEGKRSSSETIQSVRFRDVFEYPLPFDSNRTLYFLLSVAKVRNYDRLDRLFVWNYSGVKAYHQMKQDMPFNKLLDLHAAYRLLSRKIESRGELGYPSDISFSAPFLDSPQ